MKRKGVQYVLSKIWALHMFQKTAVQLQQNQMYSFEGVIDGETKCFGAILLNASAQKIGLIIYFLYKYL